MDLYASILLKILSKIIFISLFLKILKTGVLNIRN